MDLYISEYLSEILLRYLLEEGGKLSTLSIFISLYFFYSQYQFYPPQFNIFISGIFIK